MLNKKIISLFAVIMALAVIFCGCGGSAKYSAAESVAPMAYAAPQAPREPAGSDFVAAKGIATNSTDMEMTELEEDSALPADRKIVKHSSMELETKDFENAISQIISTVNQNGGYIESQSVNGKSMRYDDKYYERFADISARVPAENLDLVINSIGGICNVTSRWESIEDITDTYFDADAHLATLKLQEERLLEILSKAEKLEDVITLEQALSNVRYEIEALTARLRRMDSQVAYSYLNISLREVVEYQSVTPAPKTFADRVSDAFVRSADNLRDFCEGIVIFAIEDLPLLIIWLILWGIVLFIAIKVIVWFRKIVKSNPNRKPLFNFKKNNKNDK